MAQAIQACDGTVSSHRAVTLDVGRGSGSNSKSSEVESIYSQEGPKGDDDDRVGEDHDDIDMSDGEDRFQTAINCRTRLPCKLVSLHSYAKRIHRGNSKTFKKTPPFSTVSWETSTILCTPRNTK